MILPILPACTKDEHIALLTLELCAKLDGQLDQPILIVSDDQGVLDRLTRAAHPAFATVLTHRYEPWTGETTWPVPQNWAWQQTVRFISANPVPRAHGWLWMEPDAVPLHSAWLTQLNSDYLARPRTLFAGVECRFATDTRYMNGVGIYPPNTLDALANSHALYTRSEPFDIASGRCVMQSFKPLTSIVHVRKTHGGGPGAHFATRADVTPHASAALLHGCTDGSLQAVLLGRKVTRAAARLTSRPTYYHSGDLGDIIYSLPAIRELGGGDLLLGPDNRTNMSTRAKMTPAQVANIAPLLEQQAYIASVTHAPAMPENTTHDLNQMRVHLRAQTLDLKPGYNLARCYLHAFNLALEHDTGPWLTVPTPRSIAPVVINRSPRYHNKSFRWDRVLAEYRGNIIFIGLPHEHEAFCNQWGKVPYEPADTLLDAASIIAGSKLFIGNQSCAFAIAEGLKHPSILEVFTPGSNTIFPRPSTIHNVTETTPLPFIPGHSRPRRPSTGQPLILKGPVDSFSGFGQLVRQLTLGLAARGHNVKLSPSHFERTSFQADIPGIDPAYESHMMHPDTPAHVIITMQDSVPILTKGGEVVMTMWESSRIAHATMRALNLASRVIVPSQWAATSFDACGVDTPISIVPLGVDTSIYKPRPYPRKGPFVFGTAGRTAHGGCRKGMDDVVTAFLTAFPTDPDVRLHIKCFSDCIVNAPDDYRIILERRFLPDLSNWYAGLNVFVTASRAEGWGLHPHQALATGRPVIAPRYGALAEFFDDSVGWPLPFSLVPAQGVYTGKGVWSAVSQSALVTALQHAYTHRDECAALSKPAARRAHTFSVTHMVERFESVLKECNLL